MKRFLFCQPAPPVRTATLRGADVADVGGKTLLPIRQPRLVTRSSVAVLPHALLWSLAVLSIPATLGTRAAAQELAAEATTTQIDSEIAASRILLAEREQEQPPRPTRSEAESHSQAAASANTQPDSVTDSRAGLSSSSWSDGKSSKTRSEENHELSVEPGALQLLPDDAPAWVGSLPDLTGDVHRLFVGGHIAESASEAAEGLDTPLVTAVNQYIDTHLLARNRAARALTRKITADYVWKNLVDERAGYIARLNTPGQPMFQKWVSVSVTPEQRAAILRWDREAQQRERLAPIGLGLVSLLGGVGLLHLILRRGNR